MQEERRHGAVGCFARIRRRRAWKKVVSVLVCIVVFCTTYALILPALTKENTAYCGLEEYKHSEECYEKKLICGQEETEVTAHVHNSACYDKQQKLVCGLEEHTSAHMHTDKCIASEQKLVCQNEDPSHLHTENCYEITESYICGLAEEELEGHTHTDECYTTEEVLQCGKEEGEKVPGHTHTDACYEKTLTCKVEEHTHELGCYSDPKADIETAKDWERSMTDVELTGDWHKDVIVVAESQLGYKESEQNYMVDEDGKTKKGYTRYGAWYGDSYGDWCAMFVSFCLQYAEIPAEDFPREASCARWIEALQKEEYDFYRRAGEYTPKEGDLIFFDWDKDEKSDHVGLVAELIEDEQGELTKIKIIEGNSGNCVRYMTYERDDAQILGYGELPEKPKQNKEPAADETRMTLAYKGEDYTVEVSFTEEAQIPENAELAVRELTGDEYEECCREAKEAMVVEELSFARFFDVSFVADGEEIEPAAPVDVEITYSDPVEIPEDQVKNAVHFKEDGTEVLDATLEQKEDATTFTFTQDSFSVIGTTSGYGKARAAGGAPTGSATQTGELVKDGKYVLYAMCTDEKTGAKKAYAISTQDPSKPVDLNATGAEGEAVNWTASNDDILWTYTGAGFVNAEGKYLTLARGEGEAWSLSRIALGEADKAVNYYDEYHVLYSLEATPEIDGAGLTEHFNTVEFPLKDSGNYQITGSWGRTLMAPENQHYIAHVPGTGGGTTDPDPGPPAPPALDKTDTKMVCHKTIDALYDGITNPDTSLSGSTEGVTGNPYRLYLDAKVEEEKKEDAVPLDLLIVVDRSNSMYGKADMKGENDEAIDRMSAVQLVLNGDKSTSKYNNNGLISRFLKMNAKNKVAVVGFGGNTYDGYSPTTKRNPYMYNGDAQTYMGWTTGEKWGKGKAVNVYGTTGGGATNYCAGLSQANDLLKEVKADQNKKVMLFLSDGVPTLYLEKEGNKYYKTGSGDTGTNNVNDCKDVSKVYFDLFRKMNPEVLTCTVGVSKDITDTSDPSHSPEVLEYMARTGGGEFVGVEESSKKLMDTIMRIINLTSYSNLVISDELSDWVDVYGEPDYKVTMKSPEGVETVLYEGKKVTEAGKGKLKGDNPIRYDTADGKKTVSVEFDPNYVLMGDYTYTLSFNVVTTKAAYDDYMEKDCSYPDTGDPETDYKSNNTSSRRKGYRSNKSATLKYKKNGFPGTKYYAHPVVQVKSPYLVVAKEWYSYDNELVENPKNEPPVKFQLIQNAWKKGVATQAGEPVTVTVNAKSGNTKKPAGSKTCEKGSRVTIQFEIKEEYFDGLALDPIAYYDKTHLTVVSERYDVGYNKYRTYAYWFDITEDTVINIKYKDYWGSGIPFTSFLEVDSKAQKPVEKEPEKSGSKPYPEENSIYVLSSENNWQMKFGELPKIDENDPNTYYTYTVVEKEVSGYETTYDNNEGVSNGTITIKNKSTTEPSYELPETGGSGTMIYTMGGLLMMMVAWQLLLYIKNKRRKEDLASF